MNNLSVISTTQKIFVDPFSSTTAVAIDGPEGPPGPKGLKGFQGTGEGYATDAELAAAVSPLDSRLDTLEAAKGAWQSLTMFSPWTAYHADWQFPRYKLVDGIVFVEGLIRSTVDPPNSSLIAVLPVGYRPAVQVLFPTHTASPTTMGRVDIRSNGDVVYVSGSVGYISLSQVSFATN